MSTYTDTKALPSMAAKRVHVKASLARPTMRQSSCQRSAGPVCHAQRICHSLLPAQLRPARSLLDHSINKWKTMYSGLQASLVGHREKHVLRPLWMGFFIIDLTGFSQEVRKRGETFPYPVHYRPVEVHSAVILHRTPLATNSNIKNQKVMYF